MVDLGDVLVREGLSHFLDAGPVVLEGPVLAAEQTLVLDHVVVGLFLVPVQADGPRVGQRALLDVVELFSEVVGIIRAGRELQPGGLAGAHSC